MDKLFFSAIIGLIAGVIDIIPMIMQKTIPDAYSSRTFG